MDSGLVETVTYLGNHRRYAVRLDCGVNVTARVSMDEDMHLVPGERAAVGWRPDHAVVVMVDSTDGSGSDGDGGAEE
jgi:hypothetical protein